ncbi:MAG: nicotinate-nucleotide--dimethylbenzimidazole phosphoribosyltransferase [Reinekea sp.]
MSLSTQLQQSIDQKTKPQGSLGQLEMLAKQLGLIQNSLQPSVDRPKAFVFGADHGVCAASVNPFPQAVTELMLANFANGDAAMSVFCRANAIPLEIVNMGIVNPQARWDAVRDETIAHGSQNFAEQAAMTVEQAEQAIAVGRKLAREAVDAGHNLLIIGEMGIGNSTSASALLSALLDLSPKQTVGPGTGANDEQLTNKRNAIFTALKRSSADDALGWLAEVGGFEIAAMTGVLLSAHELGVAVMVDGFIVTAAALVAERLAPGSRDCWIFAHQSAEPAHQLTLQALNAQPLLNLGLRLGEGTGSALAYPLLKCATAMLNEMATFADLGL